MELHEALKLHWGYDTFRPKQEQIIRSLVAGRDVAAVLPTGGGKSLCYQLAAVLRGGTAVVISPLIALMDDQVRQLAEMGIPAAVLNSTLNPGEQWLCRKRAQQGAYRLLYLSPERLLREDTVAWLRETPVSFFVIDEAHCISEWGHDFRPEYRQLRLLREHFPEAPIAAFTASATKRVRQDILQQLALRDPDKVILSFYRPNLGYHIHECRDAKEQRRLLLRAVKHYRGETVIVYAPTIREVEATADWLTTQRIPAVPYHGQMEAGLRRRNQDRWMSDEIRVLVGTIAFGLGINKPSVRAVIHLSLPKSLEQFYQESGRAGRDGEPADCVLLWRKKDAGLLAHFIEQIEDEQEKRRAWTRYHVIRNFAERASCRPKAICEHFGETPKWAACGHCDTCGAELPWKEERGQAPQPAAAVAVKRVAPAAPAAAAAHPDPALADYLREWRRKTAAERGVRPYVILHDATLNELSARCPATLAELTSITGIGAKKAETLGEAILEAIRQFRRGARAEAKPAEVEPPRAQLKRLLGEGKTIEQAAQTRERTVKATVDLLASMIEDGEIDFSSGWVRARYLNDILREVARHDLDRLRPVKDALPPEVTYEEIRLVAAAIRRELTEKSPTPAPQSHPGE
jgi:ATP-dependent DNA helicase RecQ